MNRARIILGITGAVVAAAMIASSTFAVSGEGVAIQGYASDAPIDNGTIVRLVGSGKNRVKPVSQDELGNMFGVAVDRKSLPVMVTGGGLKNETFVAASGTHNVLVSDQAGPIAAGDYVTLSSVSGVGMKAGYDEETVFGRAVQPYDGKGLVLGKADLKDTTGQVSKTVKLGSIPVTIEIQSNPNEKSTKAKVPELLERIGQAIAEKPVSPIRIYLSMAITAVSIIAAIVILYSGVRNGVVSIGRNPMSKKSIHRALIEIILTSILILVIGLFAVYLLLKL